MRCMRCRKKLRDRGTRTRCRACEWTPALLFEAYRASIGGPVGFSGTSGNDERNKPLLAQASATFEVLARLDLVSRRDADGWITELMRRANLSPADVQGQGDADHGINLVDPPPSANA